MKTQDKEPDRDPFHCNCSKCQRFWKRAFSGKENAEFTELLQLPSEERAAKTSMMYSATRRREDHPAVLKLGDRVCVQDKYIGVVKFVGILDENTSAPETYVGVKLDGNIGSRHNGVYKGKRYFHCPRGHGLMARYADVIRINPPETRPPVNGNNMFPSFEKVRHKRIERSLKDPENDFGWTYNAKPSVYICDKNDIAAKDIIRQEQREKKRQQMMQERDRKMQEREDAASKQSFFKWKDQFGGGKKGDRMAKTLQKLHLAYEKGLELEKEDHHGKQDEEKSIKTDSYIWSEPDLDRYLEGDRETPVDNEKVTSD